MIYIIQNIKADLYRLTKTRGMQFLLAGIILFIALSISTGALGSVSVGSESLADNFDMLSSQVWTADVAVKSMLSQMTIVLYFLIVIPVVVIGADLKNKSYKNVITTGISRTQYFVSKSLTILITSFIFCLFYITLSFVIGGLQNGWGTLNSTFFIDVLKLFMMKFFFVYATLLLGVIIGLLTMNNIALSLSIMLVPIAIQMILMFANLGDTVFKYLDIASATGIVGVVDSINPLPYFAGATLLIVVLSTFSLQIFKRANL